MIVGSFALLAASAVTGTLGFIEICSKKKK